MNNQLSPAALAVLEAACKGNSEGDIEGAVAAALRAAADRVVPDDNTWDRASWSPFAGQIRSEILAIAAELEGAE